MLLEDDVVISGMSGVYPKSNNVEEFAEKLFAKEDLLSDAPNMPVRLGKLNDLSKFDAEFFGYKHPHRVNVMDPLSRIILEKAYEALIDSGNNPVALKGENCGVYIAVHSVETEVQTFHKIEKGAFLAQSRSFLANRISHWLGIHGPSYSVDSACSSTLVALEVAFKAIRRGDCDSAIVGGCNISLHSAPLLHLLKVGALNPKGESRVFDENAGGFCKGECIGVFYLQRAKNAKRVYARVINSHVNHDGWKPSLLAPRGPSQAALLKRIYEEAKIDSNSVAWIEAHATGTQVGDKQEVEAIASVFADRRDPLLVGSVKSNMGHAEAAAGISSLSKVIIAMETGFIPPNINITTLRKDIEGLQNGRIKVVTEKTPWNGGIVGVSGFGMGGVNSHVVLDSFKKEKLNHGIPNDDLPRIVGVSGRTEEAVDTVLKHLEVTSVDSEFVGLLQEIHKQNIPLHSYRGVILLHKNENCLVKKIQKIDSSSRKTLFVFTNFLGKFSSIYRSLRELQIFQQSVSRSNDCLAKFGLNLMDILDDCSQENSLFHSYVSSVVIQVALYDVMCSLDLVPDNIIGCSLGELVCAYADGCLSFEETLSAAFYCAAFLTSQYRNGEGVMSVLADINHSSLVSLLPSTFQLSFPSIITGADTEMTEFLNLNEISYSRIHSSDSSKIPIIKNVDELKNLLRPIVHPKIKSEKWITWLESKTNDISVEYLVKSTVTPVNFQNMVDFFPADIINVTFLSSTFCNVAQKSLKGESVSISLTDENQTINVNNFLTAIGELYLLGKNLDFSQLYPPIVYPVSRGTKMIAPLVRWKHTTSWPVAFTSKQESLLSSERTVSISLDDPEYSYLAGHEIDSTILFPGTGYLVLVWETLALICGKIHTNMSVIFENVRFLRAVQMLPKETVLFEIMVHKGTGIFEITEKGHLIATGRVHSPAKIQRGSSIASIPTDNSVILDKLDFYRYILIRGSNYKGLFRSVSQINGEGTKARISWMQNWIAYLDGVLQVGILHDTRDASYVPVEIEKIIIDADVHNQIIGSSITELDAFYDKSTNVIECGGVQIEGLTLRSILPKPIKHDPLLQKSYFLPFNSTVHKISLTELISQFCHIIMDNLGQLRPKVKIAEIFEENPTSQNHLLTPLISNFVKEQPLFKSEMKIYLSNGSVVKTADSDFITAVGNLPFSELVHVIVCSDIVNQEQKLKFALDSLHDDGFLICCEKANAALNVPTNLVLCCHALSSDIKCSGFRYILLRKKSKVGNVNKFIKVSGDNFSWIKELQEAIKVNVFSRIVLFSDQDRYSGILGFFHSLRMERNTDNIRCFLILDKDRHFSLEDPLFRQQFEKDIAINVFKNGEWGCYIRQSVEPVLPSSQVDVFHAFVRLNNLKKKSTLNWVTGPLQQSQSKNVIHVYYCAVNPTDVLLYMKRISIETILEDPFKKDQVLGIEFSGRSHCGKRLMGLRSYGCLSSHIELRADDVFCNEVPNNWSLEDAVTVPLAYYTVIYAVVFCSQLKPKESILIHSAGSPAGQAAINVASHFGCEIFVSVSSVNEKLFVTKYFPVLPKTNIINIKDDSLLKVVNEKTNGAGVDVIFDSLPIDQLATNVECLAKNGRYIQLKRVDIRNSNVNVNKLLSKNISLQSAVLEDILNLPYAKKVELKNTFDSYVKNSAIKPLHRTVYSYTAIENAIESSSLPHNFGKHIVQIEPEEVDISAKPRKKLRKACKRFLCHPEKVYVICGGLGGMGMELVNWLVIRGAKKVVISSRKGEATGSQSLRINRWKLYGVIVVVVKADISDLAQTTDLLNTAQALGSVDAIFNLAATNNSKMFKNQTPQNFITTAGPKFHGTLNLDQISRLKCPHLEHFVVFSSIASGFGSLGQTEYALFNSAVERICEERRRENLPALAVEWGGVGNVGMLVSFLDGNTDDSHCGFRMQPIKSCLEALDQFLCQTNTIVISCITSK